MWGAIGNSEGLEGILAKSDRSKNEKTFMKNLNTQRTSVVNINHYNQVSNGTNRVKQWSSFLCMGETNLKDVDDAAFQDMNWIMK